MRITYGITKRRGNWRPVLTYQCRKDKWEWDLAVPGGDTLVRVPRGHTYIEKALPGELERADKPFTDMVVLKLPSSDDMANDQKVILPWRPGAHPEYPEVHEAMQALMAEWERRVSEAMASGEFTEQFLVDPTPAYVEATQGYAVGVSLAKQR